MAHVLILIGRLLSRDGYNKWRDAKKPTTILAELCRSNGIEPPEYRPSEVKVLNKIFKIPPDAVPEGKGPPSTSGRSVLFKEPLHQRDRDTSRWVNNTFRKRRETERSRSQEPGAELL